jgi:hypothetical protein
MQSQVLSQFFLGQYISSSEAAYRTLELSMHNMYPSVQCLQLHLDGDERVIFHNGQEQLAVEQGAKPTTLTAFLSLMHNIRLTDPKHPHLALKYPDVVDHYPWDAPNYQWVLRTNNCNTWPPVWRTSRCRRTLRPPYSPEQSPWLHLLR